MQYPTDIGAKTAPASDLRELHVLHDLPSSRFQQSIVWTLHFSRDLRQKYNFRDADSVAYSTKPTVLACIRGGETSYNRMQPSNDMMLHVARSAPPVFQSATWGTNTTTEQIVKFSNVTP